MLYWKQNHKSKVSFSVPFREHMMLSLNFGNVIADSLVKGASGFSTSPFTTDTHLLERRYSENMHIFHFFL